MPDFVDDLPDIATVEEYAGSTWGHNVYRDVRQAAYDLRGKVIALIARAVAVVPVAFGLVDTPAAAGTCYLVPGFGARADLGANAVGFIATAAGSISKLRAKAVAGTTGDTLVLTVQKNASDQTLTATLAAGGTSASDLTHSFSVAAGDEISVKAVAGASTSAGATVLRASVLFTPS